MKLKAVFIFFVITAAFISTAALAVRNAARGETNFDIMADVFFPCELFPVNKEIKTKIAVLRVDDIQAFAWTNISERIINDAESRKIPLVLGVIPKDLKKDGDFYKFLRKRRCHFEIAQHGWEHNVGDDGVTPEFRGKTKKQAFEMIAKGKKIIETFSREKVLTFIPPNNEYSEGTREALKDAKIPFVSSEGKEYFDVDTSVYNYDTDSLITVDKIISDCENEFMESNLCVIMAHPQDFSDGSSLNEEKYKIYTELLDKFQNSDVSFVRFKDLR